MTISPNFHQWIYYPIFISNGTDTNVKIHFKPIPIFYIGLIKPIRIPFIGINIGYNDIADYWSNPHVSYYGLRSTNITIELLYLCIYLFQIFHPVLTTIVLPLILLIFLNFKINSKIPKSRIADIARNQR